VRKRQSVRDGGLGGWVDRIEAEKVVGKGGEKGYREKEYSKVNQKDLIHITKQNLLLWCVSGLFWSVARLI